MRHPELEQTLAQALADEQPALMPLPNAFDAFVEQPKRVTSTCLVHHEGNRYPNTNPADRVKINPSGTTTCSKLSSVIRHLAGRRGRLSRALQIEVAELLKDQVVE